jgi:uncharacterized membrane protein YcjF (UPF0283 family)
MATSLKLRQAQVWKVGTEYFRIVRLERLEVEYKSTTTLNAAKGIHLRTSKKEFCRLIKKAVLLAPTKSAPDRNEADAAEAIP